MAKYQHPIFEMYDFLDEAARALMPRVERTAMDIAAPQSWTVKYLALSRLAGVTHVEFQGTTAIGDEIQRDFQEDLAKIAETLDRDSKVVLDFAGVESFGVAAIKALIQFKRKLQTKGSRIALCALAPSVRETFFLRQNKPGRDAGPVPHSGAFEQNHK